MHHHAVTVGLMILALGVAACGGAPSAVPPTADAAATAVARQVALQKAVAGTLTAEARATAVSDGEATATPASIPAETTVPPVTPSDMPGPTPSNTPRPAPTNTAAAPACVVKAGGLNLRSGPGTAYSRLTALAGGTPMQPLAYQARGVPSGAWIQVWAAGQQGWVSASQESVTCNIDVAGLPAGTFPPPPTVAPTAPAATPTPAEVAQVIIGDNDVLVGENGSLEGGLTLRVEPKAKNPLVFGKRIAFEVRARDPNAGTGNGAGVSGVDFKIYAGDQPDESQLVYERTERTPAFCVFGGGEPDCNVLDLNKTADWPGTQIAVQPGVYFADIRAVPEDPQGTAATWHFTFSIEP